ncbi:MAG: metallophosphoesterase [Bacteroidetes bacterium]|nr:metallophosphoesterase [Bacteroidota bacterium]MBU1720136.1 metallophosphoesterase [Bacteroidota bacterium]
MKSVNQFALYFVASLTFLLVSCGGGTEKRNASNQPAIKYDIPAVTQGLSYSDDGILQLTDAKGAVYPLREKKPYGVNWRMMVDSMKGTSQGFSFDLKNTDIQGNVYFGFYIPGLKIPQFAFWKTPATIMNGMVDIDIKSLDGIYDVPGWKEKGYARVGYRIVDAKGNFIYDGKILLKGKGPFTIAPSVIEGPFVNCLTDSSAIVSFETSRPCKPAILVHNEEFERNYSSSGNAVHHEILLKGLVAEKSYIYDIMIDGLPERYSFRTAPASGSSVPFTFAYASDSRTGQGGGERDIHGTNAYMMKQIAALANKQKVAFLQFTGDMIAGYSDDVVETDLQYRNWKRAIEPYVSGFPVYVGIGNHETVTYTFENGSEYGIQIPKFPYDRQGTEKIFSDQFVNFMNGPDSEDNSVLDPDPGKMNFPAYRENVYFYTYGNVAMVVLNSNYWYSPSLLDFPDVSGNLHGYVMDNQLAWFAEVLDKLEGNQNIDHIFVTLHTPVLPNGGHSKDDMWYEGDNSPRPYIAGKLANKGIIQRRDEFLSLCDSHAKVLAVLAGDEHNYSRMKIGPGTKIYPDSYQNKQIKLTRNFWQIVNGAAGAPYYAQEKLPWTESVECFSVSNVLVLFDIKGKSVSARVLSPVTFEELETVVLK